MKSRNSRHGLEPVVFLVLWFILSFLSPGAAHGEMSLERPGAYYWGDSGEDLVADGLIGPSDLSIISNHIMTPTPQYAYASDYDGCRPQIVEVQDLDGDGIVGPGDQSILGNWLLGNSADGETGRPGTFVVNTPTVTVNGSTPETISVGLFDSGGFPDSILSPRWGFGVVFEITGGCATDVYLRGRNVNPTIGGGRDQWASPVGLGAQVFEYTDLAGDAAVQVGANSGACDGQTVQISAYVPGDAEFRTDVGRLPARFTAAERISVGLPFCGLPLTCDLSSLGEGNAGAYTCTAGCGEDVTAETTISGACTGGAGAIGANENDCSPDPGTCFIEYQWESWPVDITDDGDARTSMSCTPDPVREGQSGVTFACLSSWNEGTCTSDDTADITISGMCARASASSLNVAEDNCSALNNPGGCVFAIGGVTDSADVNNDADAQTGVTCTPTSYTEGNTNVTFACTQTWNEGTCAAGNVTASVTLSGGCSRASATALDVAENDCNTSTGTCTFTDGAFSSNRTISNDGDTRVSIDCTPETLTEGDSGVTFTCISAWNEGTCTTDDTSNVTLSGRCVRASATTLNVPELDCDSSNGQCTFLRTVNDTASVYDDGDMPVSMSCSLVTLAEGECDAPSCQLNWNEGGCTTPAAPTAGAPCYQNGGLVCAPENDCNTDNALCLLTSGAFGRSVTVTNDDSVISSIILPLFANLDPGTTQQFTLTRTWSEGVCSPEDLTASAGWWAGQGSCDCASAISSSGLFTACNPLAPCTSYIYTATPTANNNPVPVDILCCGVPAILAVFPLDFQDRYRLNAHAQDQDLTVVTRGTVTSLTAQCTGASTVNFNCDIGGGPDKVCTPASSFVEMGSYTCNVNLNSGQDTSSGTMTTSILSAPTSGGFGGGYIGGNVYDSTAGAVNGGTVTIQAIDFESLAPIAGRVYVQIIQGATLTERFTETTGTLTINLAPLPIDELTLGYKCGAERCNKKSSSSAYSDYQYATYTNLDSNDLIIPLELMSNAGQGGPNRAPNGGRYRATINGSMSTTNMAAYISPNPTSVGLRRQLSAPAKYRASIILASYRDSGMISGGLDSILMPAETETSVSTCVGAQSIYGIPYTTKASLPPNLVIPELIRTSWWDPCNTWTANPGKQTWQTFSYTPGESILIWNLGVYINAANIYSPGGQDLFSLPMTVCGLGLERVAVPSTLNAGNWSTNIGTNAQLRMDLRENWGSLGHDPDSTVDRRMTVALRGTLPVDPARRDARLSSWWTGFANSYRIPNRTDSRLGTGWSTRFYRRDAAIISGADYGAGVGIGITGLSLNPNIHDNYFTTFAVGYALSSGPYPRFGLRALNYWSTANPVNHQISILLAGPASTWGTVETVNFAPLESGGPANYSVIGALTRGKFQESRYSNRSLALESSLHLNHPDYRYFKSIPYQPGSLAAVYHAGPFQTDADHLTYVADYLKMPEPVTPAADKYLYPAPQDMDTLNSTDLNRNGELMPDRTVNATNAWQTFVSSNPQQNGRYYFQFTQPGWLAQTSRAVHAWRVSISEPALATFDGATSTGYIAKQASSTRIVSDDGAATLQGSTQWLANTHYPWDAPRFLAQGVAPGDSIWINSVKSNLRTCRCRIGVVQVNRVQVLSMAQGSSGSGCNPANGCTYATSGLNGDVDIRYRVVRANPRGECVIDDNFYGVVSDFSHGVNSDYNGVGGCKSNRFWAAYGPVSGTGNLTVLFPRVVKGNRTLGGVAAVVPDILDGITTVNPNIMLTWSHSLFAFNTDTVTQGGLGRKFAWNNRDLLKSSLLIHQAASDSHFFLYQ